MWVSLAKTLLCICSLPYANEFRPNWLRNIGVFVLLLSLSLFFDLIVDFLYISRLLDLLLFDYCCLDCFGCLWYFLHNHCLDVICSNSQQHLSLKLGVAIDYNHLVTLCWIVYSGPFSQRVLLTLEEKHLPYEPKLVDLRNKPEWWSSCPCFTYRQVINFFYRRTISFPCNNCFFGSGFLKSVLKVKFPW